MGLHAHKLVAKTAVELCNELYDTVMSNNQVRAEWKRQNLDAPERLLRRRFIAKNAEKMIEAARTTLTLMLRGNLPEDQKEIILEALVLDNTLRKGRSQGFRAINSTPTPGTK